LEEALDRIFRIGKQGGLPRRLVPVLKGLREVVEDGAYTLVLEFEAKLTPEQWEERQPKIQSFFGPGKWLRSPLPLPHVCPVWSDSLGEATKRVLFVT
jgi:hypothetical protein